MKGTNVAWFRIEDSFHSHPKVKNAGNASVGLWVRCATWSAQYLTDGYVPQHVVNDFGRRSEIDKLVASRLWVPADDGMLIPDFLDYNQSKGEVEMRRKEDAKRKREARDKGAANVEHGPDGRFK